MLDKFKFKFFIGITKHDKGFANHETKDTDKEEENTMKYMNVTLV